MNALGFPLTLAASGLVGALLVLSAGESLGSGNDGPGARLPREGYGRGCVSFFIGAQRPGEIHVHLANAGPEPLTARFELVDEVGRARAGESHDLGPNATRELTLGRPPAGTGLKVSAGSADLRAYAELVFDDGSEPEQYRVGGCP